MKIIGVIAQHDNGEVVFIRVKEGSIDSLPESVDLTGTGTPENPTPKEVAFEKEVNKAEVTLPNILSKYKEKK